MKQKNAKRRYIIISSMFLLIFTFLPKIWAQTLYGVVAWEGSLVTIDTSTGTATVVGNTGLTTPCALAYDPNRGILYAVECYGGGKLYILDPDTAAAVPLPEGNWSFGQGLAYRFVDDALYSPSFSTSEIAKIDPDNGSFISSVGEIGEPGELIVLGALSVRPSDGTLYAGGFRVATDFLFTINTIPGTSPLESEIGSTNRLISSIAFHPDDTLYASDGDYLLTIDPNTGTVTEIGPFGSDIGFVAGLAFVTLPVQGPIDIWIKDCEADVGNTPSVPTPCPVAYKSPDIWIDTNEDMIIDAPVENEDNILKAMVRNRQSGSAQNVNVKFYFRDNTTGLYFPTDATFIGEDTVTVPPNGTALASVVWNVPPPPSTGGHWCIGVLLDHPDDPLPDPPPPARDHNNIAMANIWFIAGRAGEQVLMSFSVGTGGRSGFGLTPWPRDFVVEVENNLPVGWGWTLEGIPVNQPFTLKLGEERNVQLKIQVADGAAPHSGGSLEVRQVDVVTNQIVGGLSFNLYEDHQPPEKVRTTLANTIDGYAVLSWDAVIKEAETGLRDRIAYYEILRNGEVVEKVIRDGDPYQPGIQWRDPNPLKGVVNYSVRVIDEGGNTSQPSKEVKVTMPVKLFNWLTWVLLFLILILFIFLLKRRRVF